jgi:hypothetical protein
MGMGKEEIVLATNVSCTVSNCYFWAKDNICVADNILITADKAAGDYSEMNWDRESQENLIQKIGETPTHRVTETACYTFRTR